MPTIKELRETRAKHVADARTLNEKAKADNRNLTGAETEQIDKHLDESDRIGREIDVLEKGESRSKRLAEAQEAMTRSAGRDTDPVTPETRDNPGGPGRRAGTEAREFRYKLRQNPDVERCLNLAGRTASDEYRSAFAKFLRTGSRAGTEERAIQADSDVDGGFLNAPQQLVAELIKNVDDLVPFRQFANVISVPNAQSLGVPTLDTDVDDADWTTELKTGNETALKIGKRELNPQPLAKRIKISQKLLRTSATNVEALVRERFSYKFGVSKEKAYMTGTGSNQPLGVFTAHADGISTARDVATSNAATAITADGLIEAKFFLKPQYWPNARWLFHRTAMKQIRLFKAEDGQYLWVPGLTKGVTDTVLDCPVIVSEFVPNTFTSGKYVGLLGDFSKYWIAEAFGMEMKRLDELYQETNQIGFIARAEEDGMPVLEEAFVRVKLG